MKILRPYFSIALSTFALIALLHTHGSAMPTASSTAPLNLVYVLDLSDRLLANDGKQAETDIKAILAGFDLVYERARKDLFVKAAHKFKVVAVPQKDADPELEAVLAKCEVDLAQIPVKTRRVELERFKNQLEQNLREVYALAHRGHKSSDYPGADVWKFFNDRISYQLHDGHDNQLVVLTDGYFDYEPGAATLRKGDRSTCTMPYMRRFRGNANWKSLAVAANCGLLPISLPKIDFDVLVFGLHPKHSAVNEEQLLMHFWNDWADQSGFNIRFAPNSSAPSNLNYLKRCCDVASR